MKLTEARKRVLREITNRGGKASAYDLSYPRANMMHRLQMDGLVATDGRTNSWGAPAHDGFYVITEAGRLALSSVREP